MDDVKVNIVYNDNLTFEEQQRKVDKFNEIFVDIAVRYHVEQWKKSKGEKKNEQQKKQ